MKIASRVVLVICLVVVGLYFIVFLSANQLEENWFNPHYRTKVAQYPLMRTLFYLHWDGDAKSDYLLSKKYKSLKVEIDRSEDCRLTQEMLDEIEIGIEAVMQKPGGITFEDSDIFSLSKENYTVDEILAIKEKYNSNSSDGSEAKIHILCMNRYADEPLNIGLTLEEDGMVIFWQTMKKLASNNPDSLKLYVVSTVLHEIGHQVGLKHVENEKCLMVAFVERPGNAKGALKKIMTSFCEEELEAVEQIRESL
jgi:predicted Zn-dependent protease